jgi:hypothetical protein
MVVSLELAGVRTPGGGLHGTRVHCRLVQTATAFSGTPMILRTIARHPLETLRTSARLPRLLRDVVTRYHVSPIWTVRRGLELLAARYVPSEAYMLGLFDPAITRDQLRNYLSKSGLKRLQERLNPAPWVPMVEDKGLFYRFCEVAGVPAPLLHAIIYREVPGWTRNGPLPFSEDVWMEFFRTRAPEEFVLKPAWSVYGRGFLIIQREGSSLVDHSGRRWGIRELLRHIRSDPQDRGYIVQERLRNAESLRRLSGSDGLQTLRVVTVVGDRGAEIFHANCKVIVGRNVTDNIDWGKTGNFTAEISLETGIVRRTVRLLAGAPGFQRPEVHPDTHQPVTGFALPFWPEVRTACLDAAEKFLPLRTIGWDVAVTPEGPRFVEGNAWYDPPYALQGDGIRELAELLAKTAGAQR